MKARMMIELLMLLQFAVHLETEACKPTFSPECYRNTTRDDDDINCDWKPTDTTQAANYILHMRSKSGFIYDLEVEGALRKIVPQEDIINFEEVDIWIEAKVGNTSCDSNKTSVTLNESVKYSPPNITEMRRSSGQLELFWPKAEDGKGADYEIQFREVWTELSSRTRTRKPPEENAGLEKNRDRWQKKKFKTHDGMSSESYTLRIKNRSVYQVQLRRQAVGKVLWSEWSPVTLVPLEIPNSKPSVRNKTSTLSGVRTLTLTWDPLPGGQSLGEVWYNLSLWAWPCASQPRVVSVRGTNYSASITLSESRVNITAVNSVSSSPIRSLTIPAVRHLHSCPKNQTLPKTTKNICLEWYRLTDGENRASAANTSECRLSKNLTEHLHPDMEDFVRYYYFIHIENGENLRTRARCPYYKKEGKPAAGPSELTQLNVTHNSAVVSWMGIPVQKQRGFLQHYVIWIAGPGFNEHYQVPASQTNFTFRNLKARSPYVVHVAGRTVAGLGPNTTLELQTDSPAPLPADGLLMRDKIILSVCVVALLLSIVMSVIFRRWKSKLFPMIPSPVIADTRNYCPSNQEPPKEDVDDLDLLEPQPVDKPGHAQIPEATALLLSEHAGESEEEEGGENEEERRAEEEEAEDTATAILTEMNSSCRGNPDYKRQVHSLVGHGVEASYREQREEDTEINTPTYSNGVVLELRLAEDDSTAG